MSVSALSGQNDYLSVFNAIDSSATKAAQADYDHGTLTDLKNFFSAHAREWGSAAKTIVNAANSSRSLEEFAGILAPEISHAKATADAAYDSADEWTPQAAATIRSAADIVFTGAAALRFAAIMVGRQAETYAGNADATDVVKDDYNRISNFLDDAAMEAAGQAENVQRYAGEADEALLHAVFDQIKDMAYATPNRGGTVSGYFILSDPRKPAFEPGNLKVVDGRPDDRERHVNEKQQHEAAGGHKQIKQLFLQALEQHPDARGKNLTRELQDLQFSVDDGRPLRADTVRRLTAGLGEWPEE